MNVVVPIGIIVFAVIFGMLAHSAWLAVGLGAGAYIAFAAYAEPTVRK